jgi:serine/threonine protein kinase/WD40 repeat protein
MDSSDSLKIDENLARFLAAYDQEIDGGDPQAQTMNVRLPPESSAPPAGERLLTPLHPDAPNEGSVGELLPDSGRFQLPPGALGLTPAPGGPHRIGRFELRRQLGKGGCGIVFLAYDPKLQREVALKLPRPEMLLNPDAKRRLIREALAAAEFDHPNLVPVYETGEIGPVCFIATAFCPGRTLAEWLDRQAFPVPIRQAARLVAIVAEAVQHAHDRGVLHRDLKPNNVILQELKLEDADEPPPGSVQLRGEHLVPRVVDFGLAKLVDRGGPSETATRQILGTPKYMAPEQAQARRDDIGPPADVYALGVILYEMLTGRAPYDGASDVEVLRQSIEGKPTPPRALRPDLPRDLEAICLKAMAKTTTERYRTAIDFADDLRRYLDGKPTVARPLAWSGRAARWLRRNDQFVAIVALTIVVVFVSTLGLLSSYQSQQLRKDHATVLSEQASRQRTEQEREYSRQMRYAFLAWRSGDVKSAAGALDSAGRAAATVAERPEFTHAYLSRLVKVERLTIVCPAGPVTALAVSADGTRLASGHADGTVALWDRATGKQLSAVSAHTADVTQVAFARGGALLLTAGGMRDHLPAVLGWSVSKDGSVFTAPANLREPVPDACCFAVAPDGNAMFAGGAHGLLLKRRFDEPAPVIARATMPALPAVSAIAVSSDGRSVFTAEGNTVRCWTSGLKPAENHESGFRGDVAALAATGAGLPAIGFVNGSGWLVQPVCHAFPFHTGGRMHWIATAGHRTAMNGPPGRVRLDFCDLATGDLGEVRAGAFSPDGETLFTGSADGVIRAWDVSRDARERGAAFANPIIAVAVSEDGRQFVIVDRHHIRRYEGWREGRVVGDDSSGFSAVLLTGSGVMCVRLDGRSGMVLDLTGNTGIERFRATVPGGRSPTAVALDSDGTHLALGDDAGRVSLWSIPDRIALGTIDTGSRRSVRRVVFSDDGRYLLAPTATGLGMWAVGKPDQIAEIPADDQAVFRFLPQSDRIAVAGRDGVVRLFGTNGKEELTMFGHVGRVTGLGASPDGRTLVSGGATGEVKFWDARTGVELLGLRRHSTPVTIIEFGGDGKVLITAGEGQFAVWDAR